MQNSHPSHIQWVELNGQTLTIEELVAVARHRVPVRLSAQARQNVRRCRAMVDYMVQRGIKVYGLTTGFGSKRDIFIDPKETIQLQANLIQSHAAGVGEPLPEDVARAAMLLRANTLARGNSGIRLEVLELLLGLLNQGVYPYIPNKGSVGASGDLAPLSHLTLVLMGHPAGLVFQGRRPHPDGLELRRGQPYVAQPRREDFCPVSETLLQSSFGLSPVVLEAKEGLALNNGTQIMTAYGALTLYDAEVAIKSAEIICAASIEALKGVTRAFDRRIHEARPHPGQIECAANLRQLMEGSEILSTSLNTAMLHKALKQLEQVLLYLSQSAEPSLETLREATLETQQQVRTLLDDPFPAIQDGMAHLPAATRENLDATTLELLGAQRSLQPIKAILYELTRALVFGELPTEVLPARDLATQALATLEQAVPSRPRVQDDYSIRCTPQVLGSARDALSHAWKVVEREFNAATDNPLLFPPESLLSLDSDEAFEAQLTEKSCVESVFSGGNFHGEPIGMVMDYVKVALAEVASISERRTAHLVDGHLNQGLPSLLVERSGLNSGLMIPQYTAAALVSENKVLAHPATVDSIPTCENTEDHVSMGTIAARQAREILHNVELVLGIECLTAFQALHFRRPLEPGVGSKALLKTLEQAGMRFLEEDRVLYPELERATRLLRHEVLVEGVEGALDKPLRGLRP